MSSPEISANYFRFTAKPRHEPDQAFRLKPANINRTTSSHGGDMNRITVAVCAFGASLAAAAVITPAVAYADEVEVTPQKYATKGA
jgi:hypothetical protein